MAKVDQVRDALTTLADDSTIEKIDKLLTENPDHAAKVLELLDSGIISEQAGSGETEEDETVSMQLDFLHVASSQMLHAIMNDPIHNSESGHELRSCNKYGRLEMNFMKEILCDLHPKFSGWLMNCKMSKAEMSQLWAIMTNIRADCALPSKKKSDIKREVLQKKPVWYDTVQEEFSPTATLSEFWTEYGWFKIETPETEGEMKQPV